ncbi:olfactory receptor 7G2 [Cricetulus griseus]|uniref:Olfactory receptor n=2 Tax=Cricetulus griseus TaxID=10029 RepID=A0A061I7S6_CRIGR|nr:olfactory receptor 7G2 [Cricetulus griseus]XP_027267437.1 olfactory receptor 7G2 [Cricetulus griseus]ERE74757.1 olfactory receptor 7G1-like protein [Cricetulus griseus]
MYNMDVENQSLTSDIFLRGLTDDTELQPLIFILFLCMYLITIFGNVLIMLAINCDSHLHTPMYFFLCHLSFNDMYLVSITVPKMLVNIQTQDERITYAGCLSQGCFVAVCTIFECFLLGVMAYDRYVAICYPLRYTVLMNPCFCIILVLISLFISIGNGLLHSLMVLHLSFCTDLEILHFFCEIAQVIKLACSDSLINNILIFVTASIFAGLPLFGIIFSYVHIVSTVLKMPSSEGRYRAFFTCGSHLSVVFLFYGTGFGVYITSEVIDSPREIAVASVMYSIVPPMMNPFIYSLRNRDMKEALKKVIGRTASLL